MKKLLVIDSCDSCPRLEVDFKRGDNCREVGKALASNEGGEFFPTWCPLEDHDEGIKISTISKVALTPNDCLVVNIHEGIFDDEQYAHMQQNLETTFPNNKVLVMQGGSLSVIDETKTPSVGD